MENQNYSPYDYIYNLLNKEVIDFQNPKTTSVKIQERLAPNLNNYQVGFFNSNDKDNKNERTNYRSDDEEISIIKETEQMDSSFNQFNDENINLILLPNPIKEKIKIFLCKKMERSLDKEKEEKITKSNRTERRFDDERTNFMRQALNGYLYEEILHYLEEENEKKNKKVKLKKFPEEFIAKVALVKNKNDLDMSIISLYAKYEQTDNQKNSIIETFGKIKNNPGIKKLLEMTLKQLAREYLKTEKYDNYYENLKKNKGEEKADNFKFCGNNFAGNKFC